MDMARVLVVDDDPASQRLTRDILSAEGYELVFVPAGPAALAEATSNAPDVILLDILMPEMSGFEVCRHLRLDPILAEVPVILVTALDDRSARLRGLEAGADDFVTKPVDAIELKTRVRNVVTLNRYRKLLKERSKAQRAQAQASTSCEIILSTWVRMMEMDGHVLYGRCDRVMELAMRLGRAIGLPEDDLVDLRCGVLIQGIAVMAVPVALRAGYGAGLPNEKAMVLKHEAWIIEALSPVEVLRGALASVGAVHEHWDGSGGPRGLKGGDIPVVARVLSVAIEWDLKQSGPRSTVVEQLASMKEQAGRCFEPRLIDAMKSIVASSREVESVSSGSAHTASGSAREPASKIGAWERLSLSSAGARAHFAIAVALISVIPWLTMICLGMSGWMDFQLTFEQLWPMVVIGLPFVTLGYWMLAKYPINIIRLRRYLESLTLGVVPGRVALITNEEDLVSIELLMRKVIKQTEARVQTIETQTEALLEAERQRVMIQSLGAACHHLGQPATVISSYLQLMQQMDLPPDIQSMLVECRTAADTVATILERLQHLTVYRTEPYLNAGGGERPRSDVDIVKM